MSDFDTAARQEAQRRYPGIERWPDGHDQERRDAFEAGARWGAEATRWKGRALRAESALAHFVTDGVCLTCGDGVLASGEHIDPERHAAYRYTAEDIDYARDEARAALAEVAALWENPPDSYDDAMDYLSAILDRAEQTGDGRG